MSLLSHLNPVLSQLNHLSSYFSGNVGLSTKQKVIVVSATASVAFLGVLARYLRRKRRAVDPIKYRRYTGKRSRVSGLRSPNGDIFSTASSGRRSGYSDRPTERLYSGERGASVASSSLASGNVPNADGTHLTPQQLGVMGMEALETTINYWEDALAAYSSSSGGPLAVLGPEEAGFCRDLQQLLDSALELQERSEMLFLDERSVLFRPGSELNRSSPGLDNDLSSEKESFASAQDQVADLREFEEFSELFPDLEQLLLYQAALKQLEEGGIPCRSLRTEIVRCGSDGEYLAKLHCLRLAFQHMLKDHFTWTWFADAGRQMFADLLLYADKDPKDFLIGYENMIRYLQDVNNWPELEQELSMKGVKALTFYDVVMDYILMDAFEDLEEPPSSVTAVIQNRWLSNGFKETALSTAVWSVLKAKKRMLKFPNGFMSHFYAISEQLSPLLAWGFLGPDESLKETCAFFKDQVIGFLGDIFNFQKSKFTSIEELSADVLTHLKQRVDNVCHRLSAQG